MNSAMKDENTYHTFVLWDFYLPESPVIKLHQ